MVGPAMALAWFDVGRLVHLQHKRLLAMGDLGQAADDDPVLAAIRVPLLGERRM